jgi:hypothetical protein
MALKKIGLKKKYKILIINFYHLRHHVESLSLNGFICHTGYILNNTSGFAAFDDPDTA